MSAAPRLTVECASVARGGRRVLGGASFSFGAGDAVILKGPNGSGKTSLMRALAGLIDLESGAVAIDGAPADAADRRAVCAYCGHADGVKAALTAREHLKFWAALYGGAARIGAAQSSFALSDFMDRAAATMSAGQRRRLGLARLVIAGKPVWLLDEPTASIDAESINRLAATLEAHRAAGGAVLLATHDEFTLRGAKSLEVVAAEAAA